MEITRDMNELIEALRHEDESLRFNAALDLAKIGKAEAIPVLIEALGHKNRPVRFRWAATALEKLGEQVVPTLVKALDSEGRGRASAAYVLYRLDKSKREKNEISVAYTPAPMRFYRYTSPFVTGKTSQV